VYPSAVNCIAANDVVAENARDWVVDALKVAMPSGTAAGVQLAAVLKSAEPGLASQVASAAWAGGVKAKLVTAEKHANRIRNVRMPATLHVSRNIKSVSGGPQSCCLGPLRCSHQSSFKIVTSLLR
jgi:hypothetical protein